MIFSHFQLRSFVDPKPVELGESYIPVKLDCAGTFTIQTSLLKFGRLLSLQKWLC